MKINETEGTLFSDHFLINIALNENLPGGLTAVQRDPRKLRIKLAAYAGRVEEVAPTCKLVKPGDKVVIERWEYDQMDVDDERVIAREDQLLILANEEPAPGVVIFKLLAPPKPETMLALPDEYAVAELPSHCGMVVKSSKDDYQAGELLWFQKSDRGQFLFGDNMLALRDTGYAEIMMRGWTKDFQEYKREQLGLDPEPFELFMKELGFQAL